MAFSVFKRNESERENEPSPVTPTDLVVDAESLKAKLKKLPLTGSQLIKYGLEADRLQDGLNAFLKRKKSPAKDRELFMEAQESLKEIASLIREYQNVPYLEVEHVVEAYVAAGASLKKETRERSRKNQDTMLMDNQAEVFGVFDGLGGPAAGDKASQSAANSVRESFAKFPATKNIEVMKHWMAESLKEASRRIHAESMGDGRGTTASVVKLWEGLNGERKAIIGNVGDSRVYVYRAKTGTLEQLTLDDSAVLTTNALAAKSLPRMFAEKVGGGKNELYGDLQRFLKSNGLKQEDLFASAPKSKEEAKAIQEQMNHAVTDADFAALSSFAKFYFEFNHLVDQALGEKDEITPQVIVADVEEGDVYILCSDGIGDNSAIQRIQEIVASGKTPDEIAHDLANESQMASHDKDHFRHKPDDMTAVVVAIPMKEKKALEAAA